MNETGPLPLTCRVWLCLLPGWTRCRCLADPAQTDVSEARMWLWTGWTDRGNNETQKSLRVVMIGDWCPVYLRDSHTYRPTQGQLHWFNPLCSSLSCAVAWLERDHSSKSSQPHWQSTTNIHKNTHRRRSNLSTRTAEPSYVACFYWLLGLGYGQVVRPGLRQGALPSHHLFICCPN